MKALTTHKTRPGFIKISAIWLCFISGIFVNTSFAEEKAPAPILLDKEALSGLGLERLKADWIPADREVYRKTLFEGTKLKVSVLAATGAKHTFKKTPYTEFIRILNGRATLTEKNGTIHTFETGDFFIVPKGFEGEWHSEGNRYYQQLIISSKERSEGDATGVPKPLLIDRSKLSGIGLDKRVWERNPEREVYTTRMHKGDELTVAIVAGAAAKTEFTKAAPEEFVYVVNGSATLTPLGGKPQTFYAGDFFIVPEGFQGTWETRGHHLYRELIAVASKK